MTASKRSTAVGLPQHVFLRLFAVHRQRTATHMGNSTPARHSSAAQFVSALLQTVSPKINCIKRINSQVPSVISRLTSCATRVSPEDPLLPFGQFTLCCACGDPPICVAERYLTLRIRGYMSARSASLRKKKSSAVPLFSQRSHVGNLRQTL